MEERGEVRRICQAGGRRVGAQEERIEITIGGIIKNTPRGEKCTDVGDLSERVTNECTKITSE